MRMTFEDDTSSSCVEKTIKKDFDKNFSQKAFGILYYFDNNEKVITTRFCKNVKWNVSLVVKMVIPFWL